MNWVVLIGGMVLASLCNLSMTVPGFIIGAILASLTGALFVRLTIRKPKLTEVDWNVVNLKRMAARLHDVAHEGTLSKSGSVVRFDADGGLSADEFINTVLEIVELGR